MHDKLFKVANQAQCGHSNEVMKFNLRYYMQMICENTKYTMKFDDAYRSEERDEILKAEDKRAEKEMQKEVKKMQGEDLNEIKEEEEQEDLDETKDTEMKEEVKEKKENEK